MDFGKSELVIEETGHVSLHRVSGEAPGGRWMHGFKPYSRESFDRAASYVGCTDDERRAIWQAIQNGYHHMTYEERLQYVRN